MAEIFIIEAETSPVRLHVNGLDAVVMVGVDAEVDDIFLPVLRDANIKFRVKGEPGPATALMHEEPDPDFDAETIILGKVDDVVSRLSDLTAEQLEAVKAAETDREQARSGVLKAIEKIIAERNDAG